MKWVRSRADEYNDFLTLVSHFGTKHLSSSPHPLAIYQAEHRMSGAVLYRQESHPVTIHTTNIIKTGDSGVKWLVNTVHHENRQHPTEDVNSTYIRFLGQRMLLICFGESEKKHKSWQRCHIRRRTHSSLKLPDANHWYQTISWRTCNESQSLQSQVHFWPLSVSLHL